MTFTYAPERTYTEPATYTDDDTDAVYRVWPDEGTEDPRGWIEDESVALYAYRSGYPSVANDVPDNIAAETFNIYYRGRDNDDEEALRLTRRYLALFHGSEGWQVDTFSLRGYMQSQWWDVFVAVREGYGTPESHAHVWEQWARGDVFVVENAATGEAMGGIYAEDEEDAVRYFRDELEAGV